MICGMTFLIDWSTDGKFISKVVTVITRESDNAEKEPC